MARICIIANPVSGGGKARRLAEALVEALEARNQKAELLLTQAQGDAGQFAARPGAECVVSVGGDGTANEVANGLSESDARMAILPTGAANVVARELGLSRDPEALADLIVDGNTRIMDAGLINGRRFLLGAGAGLDAAVVAEVHANRHGRKIGVSSYVRPTLKILRNYAFPAVEVTIDGNTVCNDGQYVIIGNCRRSAGVFEVTPKALIDDGLLDVCILRDLSILRLVRLLLGVKRPGFTNRKDVLYVQGRSVLLRAAGDVDVPFQIDGDPAGVVSGDAGIEIGVEPQALRVIAPAQKG